MYSASDLRKGLRVEIDGVPYIITEFSFNKPGKGQSIYNCKMKNMFTGGTIQKAYRSNDKIDKAKMEQKNAAYSYSEGDNYIFLDDNYEQISITSETLGKSRFFLTEDLQVEILFHNNTPIDVTLPTFITKKIVHTEPGAKGNTATNVLKPAQVEGGYELQVPLFVNQGDLIKIDTRTGEYSDRVATF